LPKDVEVASVTGLLPPAEREARVLQLAQSPKHVLVATDCLSEGINLQVHFDAVVHYDLSWNPTRHEQREGRVDRYGQRTPTVRVMTYYGVDTQIDGVVLDVLLRKHKAIRTSLGISVPVPVDTEQVIEAIFEGLLLKGKQPKAGANPLLLPGFDDYFTPELKDLSSTWEASSEREKRSRTLFAQESIKVDEVTQELKAVQESIGSGVDVAAFTRQGLSAFGATVSGNNPIKIDLTGSSTALAESLATAVPGTKGRSFQACFQVAGPEGALYLTRTHPVVETLANHVLETALDPLSGDAVRYPASRRCGVIRTKAVSRRHTLLVVRFRFHIISIRGESEKPLLAEECQVLGFTGSPQNAEWLDQQTTENLLQAQPDGNISPEQAGDFVSKVIDGFEMLKPHLEETARNRGDVLLDAHQRVRRESKIRNMRYRVEPQAPPDVLGIYIYLPI
jgi:hypothetical protein